MTTAIHPSLYQINTRVWLTELSKSLGRAATLDDIPDAELDRLVKMGFDWIWFLSVWQIGPAGQRVSRSNHEWRREFEETLPDLREEDIPGSGFAITTHPHQMWQHDVEDRPLSRGFKPSGKQLRQLAQGGRRVKVPEAHPLHSTLQTLPEHITVTRATLTKDTPENRFVKFALRSFHRFFGHHAWASQR